MKPIPKKVAPEYLEGLHLRSRGKVCEIYDLPENGHALKVISDRVSAHDIILPFKVPNKGVYLNLIDRWWRSQMPWVQHDVVAVGEKIDRFLPDRHKNKPDLQRRARVISLHTPLKVELVFRYLLTGTGLKMYKKSGGYICGQKFPDNMAEWDEINPSAATPTTKDDEVHDVHMDIKECLERFGRWPIALTHPLFEIGRRIAAEHDLVIADTKFEVGLNERGGHVLIDEVLTPDSSRYLSKEELERARATKGYRPKSFDKQPIRDYLLSELGVGSDTPLTDEVVNRVHNHSYPQWLIEETAERYKQTLRILTGMTMEEHIEKLNED